MKKIIILIVLLVLASLLAFLSHRKTEQELVVQKPDQLDLDSSASPATEENTAPVPPKEERETAEKAASFLPPLNRAAERVTKKRFGTFVTPGDSPVEPERFRGYHTGADFEVFPEEIGQDVSVRAVCSGKLLEKRSASGYGGVAVQSCKLNGAPITIVYGHLRLASISASAGASLQAGDVLGVLGNDHSAETDGERKHLHLGFHRGTGVNILGYVESKGDLSGWIDPCTTSVCGQ